MMLAYERLGVLFYVLIVFAVGYLGVVTLHGLWSSADKFQQLSTTTEATADHTVLVLDQIDPASGKD